MQVVSGWVLRACFRRLILRCLPRGGLEILCWVSHRTFRHIKIPIFSIGLVSSVFCPLPPGIPVSFMPILVESFDASNIELVRVESCFVCRYRTGSNSILVRCPTLRQIEWASRFGFRHAITPARAMWPLWRRLLNCHVCSIFIGRAIHYTAARGDITTKTYHSS